MLIVKKFGGSSVADRERIFNVAERCVEEYKKGNDVIVVLSAMGDTTDELIAKAKEINPNASRREMDMLLTTGEQVSVSLMAMAISSMGIPAVSLNAFQVGMHCTSAYGNARFKRVDADRIRHELEYRKIVIITGFQGVNKYEDYVTLGQRRVGYNRSCDRSGAPRGCVRDLYRRGWRVYGRPENRKECKKTGVHQLR